MTYKHHRAFYLSFALLATVVVLNMWQWTKEPINFGKLNSTAAVITSIVSGIQIEPTVRIKNTKPEETLTLRARVDEFENKVRFEWEHVNKAKDMASSYWLYCSYNSATDFILVARIAGTKNVHEIRIPVGTQYCRLRANIYEKGGYSSTIIRSNEVKVTGLDSEPF
jgi:hypothetical protein